MRQAVEDRWFPGWPAGEVLQRRLPDRCASRTAPDSTGDRSSLTRSLPRRTGPMSADEQGTNWRPPTERSVRRAHRIFSVTPATGCVTHVETRKGMSCRGALGGAEPIPRGCRVNAVPLSDLLVSLPGDGFSLRIAGDWRADHSRDVVDTEPKMTKALLIAGGGFIPDEDRILRPADRPGRPPFLRAVGANQSRDDGDGAHPAHRHLPGFTTLLYSIPVT